MANCRKLWRGFVKIAGRPGDQKPLAQRREATLIAEVLTG